MWAGVKVINWCVTHWYHTLTPKLKTQVAQMWPERPSFAPSFRILIQYVSEHTKILPKLISIMAACREWV